MLKIEFMVPSLKRLERGMTGVSSALLSSAIVLPKEAPNPTKIQKDIDKKGKGSDCKGGDDPSEACGECCGRSRATNIIANAR